MMIHGSFATPKTTNESITQFDENETTTLNNANHPRRQLRDVRLMSHQRGSTEKRVSHSALETSQVSPPQNRSRIRRGRTNEYGLSLSPVVNAVRADPFNCWPVAWNRDLDQNFRFLVHDFGPCMFGYAENDIGFDIFRSQAQLALRDPAAFHSLMIISTLREGQMHGQSLPSMNSLWHRIEAIRIVKNRIEGGDMAVCTTEGSIYAVMVLIGIAAQWNAIDHHAVDVSALDKLIVHKGGLKIIGQEYPVLETSLFGMAVINPGMLRSDLYVVNDPSILEQTQDVKLQMYSMLGFIRACSGIQEKLPLTMSRIREIFAPGRTAYNLLVQTPNHPGIFDDRQQRLQTRLRAHVAVYVLCILIWASDLQVQRFLHHLDFMLIHANLWKNSLRMFAWALVCNIPEGSLMFPMQAWQSYEILCAGISLPDDLRIDVLNWMLELLVGREDVRESVHALTTRVRLVMFRSAAENK